MRVAHKLGLKSAAGAALGACLGCATSEGLPASGSGGVPAGPAPDGGAAATGGQTASGGSGGSGAALAIEGGAGSGPVGGVPQTCAQAESTKSYIGCEYWPTITPNSSLSEVFEFAIAATNPTDGSALVTVEKGGKQLAQVTIAPGELSTLTLPWDAALKQTRSPGTQPKSALVPGGAFHVTSSVPIVLYQFNPLEFSKGPPPPVEGNCMIDVETNSCFSFSNDASLLLPTTALRTEYYAVTRPSFQIGNGFNGNVDWTDYPSFVTVVGTQAGTTLSVKSSAKVRAGSGVAAQAAGTTQSFTLGAGDVLVLTAEQLSPNQGGPPGQPCAVMPVYVAEYHLCTSGQDYDFTGTKIVASHPVQVIAGHDCAMVPHHRWACDHLEESMPPIESLGQELVVTAPQSTTQLATPGATEPMFVRILSAGPNNQLTFDPPGIHPKVTLGETDWVEVGPVTQDFVVRGTHRLLVAQFMTGKNDTGYSIKGEVGDPAQSLAIPAEQFRTQYTFLAPATYTFNFVNVIAKPGVEISLDGKPIAAASFAPIGDGTWQVARQPIDGGSHTMNGSDEFGIVVYGYGNFTSYMVPGGQNLETVIVVPK